MGLCSKSATLVKEDQCRVVAGIVGGTDVFAVPPTGYTNSLCYVCLPLVFDQLEAESREQYNSDYYLIQERLHSLPEKLHQDVMVPVGRFAYMPGQLYHTNEILVLLGDNWFTKRTAQQAESIAERRKIYVLKQLEQERQILSDLEARLSFNCGLRNDKEDTVDIIEKCDHEEGSGVKARRRRKVGDKNSHQEVWQRLEELEKEENEFLRKEAGKEDEGREGEEKVKLPLYVIIPVQHTNTGGKDNEDIKLESLIQKTVPYYRTPADIVCKSRVNIRNGSGDVVKEAVLHAKKHVSWNPKFENADSIIKQSSLNLESEMPKVTLNPVKTSQLHSLPFSDYVVERSFIQSEVTSDDQKQDSQRKVSKFKTTRL